MTVIENIRPAPPRAPPQQELEPRRLELSDLSKLVAPERLDAALVTHQPGEDALDYTTLGMDLVRQRAVDEARFVDLLAWSLRLPSVRLAGLVIDPEVIALVPRVVAERYQLIPLGLVGSRLHLAMSNPRDPQAVVAAKETSGHNIGIVLAGPIDMEEALHRHYVIAPATRTGADGRPGELAELSLFPHDAFESDASTGQPDHLVRAILRGAVARNADQIHIQVRPRNCQVFYRVDGFLSEVMLLPKELAPKVIARLRQLAGMPVGSLDGPRGQFRAAAEAGIVHFTVCSSESLTLDLRK